MAGLGSELGRILASLRVRSVKPCQHCGKEFEGTGDKHYCSNSCKQAAAYLRRKLREEGK